MFFVTWHNYIVHNKFINTPLTGLHLITPAFYVADAEDFSIYDSEKEQAYFKSVFEQLKTKNLNINNLAGQNVAGKDITTYINNYVDY